MGPRASTVAHNPTGYEPGESLSRILIHLILPDLLT